MCDDGDVLYTADYDPCVKLLARKYKVKSCEAVSGIETLSQTFA